MTEPTPSWATELYRLLPQVYRARDTSDDLRRFFEACGDLLELIRQALGQRLADSLPDDPQLQGWLLPYMAELVDAGLMAPDEEGRREELVQAVTWRQRKGTLPILAPVVRAVGRYEADPDLGDTQRAAVVIVEGSTRVAVTPRIGARARGLPLALLDFRYWSRRSPSAPATELLHQGVPVHPGTSEDLSRRTPDVRQPTFRTGHFHPQRIIAFVPPRSGFFPPGWDSRYPRSPLGPGEHVIDSRTLIPEDSGALHATGPLTMTRCVVRGDLTISDGQNTSLADTIVTGTLRFQAGADGAIDLQRCAVARLVIERAQPDGGAPRGIIEDSLLDSVEAAGRVQIVGSTFLGAVTAADCQASDSLFAEIVVQTQPSAESCFRFSRIPPQLLEQIAQAHQIEQCTTELPLLTETVFGKPGCGVLHPASVRLRSRAENGGEVGAYNHLNYALRDRATLQKLADYLPVGMQAALVHDSQLSLSFAAKPR